MENIFDYDHLNEITDGHIKAINNKKTDLIKQKLVEKGYAHLVENIERRRFPRIARVIKGEWEYYFADNGTDEGDFIIAIKTFNSPIEPTTDGMGVIGKTTLQWQDTDFSEVRITNPSRF